MFEKCSCSLPACSTTPECLAGLRSKAKRCLRPWRLAGLKGCEPKVGHCSEEAVFLNELFVERGEPPRGQLAPLIKCCASERTETCSRRLGFRSWRKICLERAVCKMGGVFTASHLTQKVFRREETAAICAHFCQLM